jgi:hypothetical protein
MKNPSLFFICAFILVSTLSFSLALSLEKDVDSTITFPVTFNGSNAQSGTTCNLSVIYPNQSLMVENVLATYTNTGVATYTIPDNSINGPYKTPITCTYPDGSSEEGNADFTITPNGEVPNGAQTSVYLGLIIVLLIILIIIIFSLYKIDNFGWKMGLTSFAYIVANVFLLVCWKTTEAFLTAVPFIETAFRILYIVSNVGYFPMFISIVVYMLMHITDEKTIETMMTRGFTEDQARAKTKRS